MKNALIGIGIGVAVIASGLTYWFVFRKDLSGRIVIPYIAHQKPRIDPHVPSSVPIADKLDEVVFDGLFNVSANPSGIIYEDGLGEFMGIDAQNVVTVRLNPSRKWHASYTISRQKEKITVSPAQNVFFVARDLEFTLQRIQRLGSLSPDYILVHQAVPDFRFAGPDDNGQVRFQFRGDRIWTEGDIKEILSFKVLPANSAMDAPAYTTGTGPYLLTGEYQDLISFQKMPDGSALIGNLLLKPYVDNSTYTTELRNRSINMLLSTPFGSKSPILGDTAKFAHKSSIATTFFALFFNTQRLSREQRVALRAFVDNGMVMNRFFKVGTQQQRNIADYRGDGNNYEEYLNYSVFPTTSYYVEEEVVMPLKEFESVDYEVLPDTVRIQTCLNFGYREELSELVRIMNDPGMYHGRIKVTAVSNEEIRQGTYDAVLVPISGYRSNFLFDLYSVFLREPDFDAYRIHLQTRPDTRTGRMVIDESSWRADKNFMRLDLSRDTPEKEQMRTLLQYIYGFMSTSEIGDKQAYAQRIDRLDQELALASWLFSLPSLAYFSTQFDASSVDMYGTASQLSTVERWRERVKKK